MFDIFHKLKHFDAYPKPLEDFRVKTLSGALISLVCTGLVVLLFLYEWNTYLTLEVDQELFVDLTRNQKLTINLDLTFPRLHCSLLSLDAMDVSGESQLDVVKGIKKQRLNPDGSKSDDNDNNESSTTTTTTTVASTSIGSQADLKVAAADAVNQTASCQSCYGAETSMRKCCNTCDEVRAAYRLKNWHFSPIGVEQCKQDLIDAHVNLQASSITKDAELVSRLIASNEGCRMHGHLEVSKVAGNFHIVQYVALF